MPRYLLPALATLALLAALTWAFLPRPLAVETATVEPRPLTVELVEDGEARIREVFTLSAPIAGQLQRIALHAGDAVTEGQTVARIGPAPPALLDARSRAVAEAAVAAAEAAVDLAAAQVTQAQAALDYAQTEADRSRALFDRAALSRRLLDNANLAQLTAGAALQSARASLAVRQQELQSARAVLGTGPTATDDCCDIPTPVAGRILRVLTEDEQVVQAGTPILDIGDPARLEVVVNLLSRDAVRVAEGAPATIRGWGGADIPARVERIEPAAVTEISALGIEEQRVETILTLTGDPAAWRGLGHGFRVIAGITVWQGQDVLSVPVPALFRDGSDWAVYTLRNGRARLQRIALGERNDAFAQVLDGLAAGDRVLLHPGDAIADGTRVSSAP